MKYSKNGRACMCVKRVTKSATVHAKKCHACDNSEMQMKTKTFLVQANIHANENNFSQKSSRQHSLKLKHKK